MANTEPTQPDETLPEWQVVDLSDETLQRLKRRSSDVAPSRRAAYERHALDLVQRIRQAYVEGDREPAIEEGVLGYFEKCPGCERGHTYERITQISPSTGGVFRIPTTLDLTGRNVAISFQNDPVRINVLDAQICQECSGMGRRFVEIVDVHPAILQAVVRPEPQEETS